jgi:hypothetical protein
MSEITRIMCGVILITVPTIEFGGVFLLRILSGKEERMELTPFQKSMFRAGHAHAGVIVLLSLICEILCDHISLAPGWVWTARIGVPLAAIVISGGFFAAAAGKGITKPNKMIAMVFIGAFVLAVSMVTLGVGLIKG